MGVFVTKIILLEDVKNVGKKDQIIDVSEGHARNFLIPKNMAVEATKANLSLQETKRKSDDKKRRDELEAAQKMKSEFESQTIKISVKSGTTDKIFGSVTTKEIAIAFENQTGVKVDRKKIILDEPIKTKGQKQVLLRLHPEVTAKLNLEIE